jgi:hypothetical protein
MAEESAVLGKAAPLPPSKSKRVRKLLIPWDGIFAKCKRAIGERRENGGREGRDDVKATVEGGSGTVLASMGWVFYQ